MVVICSLEVSKDPGLPSVHHLRPHVMVSERMGNKTALNAFSSVLQRCCSLSVTRQGTFQICFRITCVAPYRAVAVAVVGPWSHSCSGRTASCSLSLSHHPLPRPSSRVCRSKRLRQHLQPLHGRPLSFSPGPQSSLNSSSRP